MKGIDIQRNYSVDILRVVFAVLIVSLHVSSGDYFPAPLVLLSRLGVPFFFVTTGYFFSLNSSDGEMALRIKKYIKHTTKLLLVWFIIYSPILIKNSLSIYGNDIRTTFPMMIQETLFKTPAFLWYLLAGIVGALIFCIFKKHTKFSLILAVSLYIIGVFGNSYLTFWPQISDNIYYKIFLTTRNGVFFAFPMMIFGASINRFIGKQVSFKKNMYILAAGFLLFCLEFLLVRTKVTGSLDTSMYFFLPVVVCMLLKLSTTINVGKSFFEKHPIQLANLSLGIYLMQFGVITALSYVQLQKLVVWILTCIISACITIVFLKIPILKRIML